MGAEISGYVEVAVTKKEWRKSYGVTDNDFLENVELGVGESITGQVKYGWQLEQEGVNSVYD
jgi:hypothetical protein